MRGADVTVRCTERFNTWAPNIRAERDFSFTTIDELSQESNRVHAYAEWLTEVERRGLELRERVTAQGWVGAALRIAIELDGQTAVITVTALEDTT